MSQAKNISAIIAAAGISSRMKRGISKQFLLLAGKPILLYSLEKFLSLSNLNEIIVVTNDIENTDRLLEEWDYKKDKRIKSALGGKLRQDSVFNGFVSIKDASDLIIIHDVARPLFEISDLINCLETASKFGAAILASPVIDTVKKVRKDKPPYVDTTLDRNCLYQVHTPQVFSYSILREVYEKYNALGNTKPIVTDEAQLLEIFGYPVTIVIGTRRNIKITYPEDVKIAESILKIQSEENLTFSQNLML